jgi:hypothetical protein
MELKILEILPKQKFGRVLHGDLAASFPRIVFSLA